MEELSNKRSSDLYDLARHTFLHHVTLVCSIKHYIFFLYFLPALNIICLDSQIFKPQLKYLSSLYFFTSTTLVSLISEKGTDNLEKDIVLIKRFILYCNYSFAPKEVIGHKIYFHQFKGIFLEVKDFFFFFFSVPIWEPYSVAYGSYWISI